MPLSLDPTYNSSTNPIASIIKIYPALHYFSLLPLKPSWSKPPPSFAGTLCLLSSFRTVSSADCSSASFIVSEAMPLCEWSINDLLQYSRVKSKRLTWFGPCCLWSHFPLSSSSYTDLSAFPLWYQARLHYRAFILIFPFAWNIPPHLPWLLSSLY